MDKIETTTFQTMCPMNCHPTLCGMVAKVSDGKIINITGDESNPDSKGFLCVRGRAAKEIIGKNNDPQGISDLFWILAMHPEFQLIQ